MRILHVITDLKVGGESRHLLASIQTLPEFEHVLACLSVNLNRNTSPRDLSSEFEAAGIQLIDLGVRRRRPGTLFAAMVRLARIIHSLRPDLIDSSLVHANLLTLIVSPPGIPVISSVVSVNPWTARWQRPVHRLLCRRARVVLANSPSVARALIASRGAEAGRIRPLPYGVDERRFAPDGEIAPLGEGRIVLGIGRLIDDKGFSDLIAAVETMDPKPSLVLVGQGPLAETLRREAADLGVDLLLTGGLEDVAPYLRRADVVAIPSRREGVPNVLLEALATGRPVVASSVGGIPDVVRDGEHALLVPPANPAVLARALERALSDDGEHMAQRGRELVLDRYGWSRYIDERRLLYESLVAGAAPGRRAVSPKTLTMPSTRSSGAGGAAPQDGRTDGLVLVVPKAGSEVTEHFAHTFRFAEHLRRHTRTAVIVERLAGDEPETDPSVEVYVQRHADENLVRRAWELMRLAGRLRKGGFSSFFVRTSQTAAVPLILTRRLFGGRVMYWNCGKVPKRRLRDVGIGTALRSEIPMRIAFRWADTVVTGTDSLAEHYSRTYGIPRERMAVLPNEIDLDRFRPPSQEDRREARAALDFGDEPLILSVHRFSPIRRTLMYVPSVLQAVIERHPTARFVFAGGGPEEAQVRRAVTHARLDDQVEILGAVPHDRLWPLYAAADIFMMPSYTEGFPRVLLEAMAMCVPLASTDVGGVREIVPSGYRARLANPDRPLELARAIEELLADPAAARELANEARGWVRQFDAPRVARQLVSLATS